MADQEVGLIADVLSTELIDFKVKLCFKLLKMLGQCFRTKSKNTTTTKQKIKHKNPCRSRELNPGPLAPKADALPLHHQVN